MMSLPIKIIVYMLSYIHLGRRLILYSNAKKLVNELSEEDNMLLKEICKKKYESYIRSYNLKNILKHIKKI